MTPPTPPLTSADLYRHSLTLLLEKDIDGRMTHCRDYGNPAAIPGSPGGAAFFPAGLGEPR